MSPHIDIYGIPTIDAISSPPPSYSIGVTHHSPDYYYTVPDLPGDVATLNSKWDPISHPSQENGAMHVNILTTSRAPAGNSDLL